ncbi:hypothetical protein F5613_003332, partial [Macellibacteroides fermentans]|nr:hypothetical protein [Macellibacteroides fermentans]
GTEKIYEQEAYNLGKTLAEQNIELVYGGANVGLMGAVANGVLDNNGKAIGVLPTFLQKVEIGHDNLTELILVETMHQRKTKMDELSDGIITPSGRFWNTRRIFLKCLHGLSSDCIKNRLQFLTPMEFYDELYRLYRKW